MLIDLKFKIYRVCYSNYSLSVALALKKIYKNKKLELSKNYSYYESEAICMYI